MALTDLSVLSPNKLLISLSSHVLLFSIYVTSCIIPSAWIVLFHNCSIFTIILQWSSHLKLTFLFSYQSPFPSSQPQFLSPHCIVSYSCIIAFCAGFPCSPSHISLLFINMAWVIPIILTVPSPSIQPWFPKFLPGTLPWATGSSTPTEKILWNFS